MIGNKACFFKSGLFFHHFHSSIEIGNLVNQLRIKRLLSGEYPAVSNGLQFRTRDAGPALLDDIWSAKVNMKPETLVSSANRSIAP